jgi:glycosyltransferase involved in cell wall biosynthesis
MKKNLHFFTASFPFGNAPEGAFIVPELFYTSQYYEHIYLYTLRKSNEIAYQLPSNVSVVILNFNRNENISIISKIKLMSIVFTELIRTKEYRKISVFKFLYSQLKQYHIKGQNILPALQKNLRKEDLLYTFWFAEWNYILSLLKKDNKINNTLISKAHGFDLYNERNNLGSIPFRKLQLKYTNKVFTISEQGKNYLTSTYPLNKHQFDIAKLGTFNHGANPVNQNKKQLILVSCSSISDVKRVHLIAELLKQVTVPVKWAHFGNGANVKKIEASIKELPDNITTELMGHVNNEKVIDYYKLNPVDLFINVSESEGIPVSIMEAISFGIPVVAFDVGGVSEIVGEKTGLLVQNINDTATISTLINNFQGSKYETKQFRASIIDFWKQEYSAETNHTKFSKAINRL